MTRAALDRVIEEAKAAYARGAEECCGLLTGPAADPLVVDGVVPLENRATKLHGLDPVAYPRSGRTAFEIDPLRFGKELEQGEAAGRPVKVLYHSHVDVGAYFSDTDAAAAKAGGEEPAYDLAYVVASVRQGLVDDVKVFAWSPATGTFVEGRLEVT